MSPGLVSVKLIFGMQDKEPAVWQGSYSLTSGRIIATDGWRFMADDHAGLSAFKLEVRPFYELFWSRKKGKPLPMEPNGLILTFDGVTPASELKVETNHGAFVVPVSKLAYGSPRMYLGEPAKRQVEVERVPTSRTIVAAPHVQDYAVRLIMAIHPEDESAADVTKKYVRFGASPRGAQALLLAGKVQALTRERYNVAFEDIRQAALPALRHRILLNFEAQAEGITTDQIVKGIVEHTPTTTDS